MKIDIICSGFGGQGVLTVGKFLASAAMTEGKHVSWLPSYGPEMRGGTANVSVIISSSFIASPMVTKPDILIALNQPSIDKFAENVKNGGTIIFNSDLCPNPSQRRDIDSVSLSMSKIAMELGDERSLNMVSIGAVIKHKNLVKYETVKKDLIKFLSKKNPELLKLNLKAIKLGMDS